MKMENDLVVLIHLAIESKIIKVPYTNSTNAEEICTRICKNFKFSPVSIPLFGLRKQNANGTKVWLAPNSKLDILCKYEFRVRFKVSSLARLYSLDRLVYDYYFHQARRDILDNQVPEIVYSKHKDELLGLGVTDMYREMIEHNVSAEELEKNYKRFIPREVMKKHSFFTKKPIHNSLGRIKKGGHDVWYVKSQYLKQMEIMAPNYLSEEYPATTDMGGTCCACLVGVAPFHSDQPGVRLCYDSSKEWQHLCSIEDLCFVSIRNDGTVEISRRNGVPSYLKFSTMALVLSFVSLLDGYYRLTVKWTFNLCKEVSTPSLRHLYSIKCHGPVGGEFSYAKLEEKRSNQHGCFIIRECEYSYNTYYIDVCTKSCKPETHKVSIDAGQWVLHGAHSGSDNRYDTIAHLISLHNDPQYSPYLHECLPPSEYDKSPLLLCEPIAKTADFKANVNELQSLIGAPHCINAQNIQYFKSTKKDSEEGVVCVYKAMWKLAKGKKIDVAMKVLKQEHTDEHMKGFMDLASKWAFIESNCIVRLYGVTLGNPVSMVMEHLSYGPLDQYLRDHADTIQQVDLVEAGSCLATALWHLQENNIIHGNIRCHKLLVAHHDSSNFAIRLADPGLHISYSTRDVHWIPVECYQNLEFAQKTGGADVWAFATTLWEIFSIGTVLPEGNLLDAQRFYLSGKRLPQPDCCPSNIYSLMRECWDLDPHRRKQPQAIMRDLNQILYQVFNSRRTHSYSTVYPKSFKENSAISGSATSLFSTATDETFLVRDLQSAIDMERDSTTSISSGFSGGSSQHGWDFALSREFLEGSPMSQEPFGGSPDGSEYNMSAFFSHLNMSATTGTATTSLNSIIDSMNSMTCIYELSADCNLVLQGRIGQGFYGEVFRGTLERDKDTEPQLVAVKKLKTNALSSGLQDFEREISIMKTLKHPNIVEILCVMDDPEIQLVMEFVQHGSLQSYLKIYRDSITTKQLVKYALDVAQGMEYLGQKHVVHRDLAARNILVVNDHHVKISDFGLAQVTGKGEYYILKTNRDLPIKWYAPESLCDGKFSPRSDVWSYGVTMYETFSYGEDPSLLSDQVGDGAEPASPPQHQMLILLEQGIRLKCPDTCPSAVYTRLMYPCWKLCPNERPSFTQLYADALEMLGQY